MAEKIKADIIVKNGDLFTAEKGLPHLRPGAIAILNNLILAVGTDTDILNAYEAETQIDAHGAIVHPGLIDTHFHLVNVPFHSLPMEVHERSKYTAIYSEIKSRADENLVSAFAAATAVSLLKKGFTCFVEPGTVFETDAFAETVTKVGTRALVAAPYGWDDLTTFRAVAPGMFNEKLLSRAPENAKRVLDQSAKELKRNEDKNALVRGFVCLYGDGTGTNELIANAKSLANDHGVIFNQHQGFMPITSQAEKKHFGDNGFVRMSRQGALDEKTLITHANVVEAPEADLIKKSSVGLVWCPHQSFKHGLTRHHKCYFPEFYQSGVTISIAIDIILFMPLGAASLAAILLASQIGESIPVSAPFYMQSINAAKNIGLGDKIGSIAAGKRADIVVRSLGDITQLPLDEEGAMLSTSCGSIPVDTVIVDGKIVMSKGRLTTMDEDIIRANAITQRDIIIKSVLG